MKEELKALKESTLKIKELKEKFIKQKIFFNMKVEEQKNILGIEEVFNSNNNSFEAAIALNEEVPELREIVSELKEEHPKYGDKRLKEMTLKRLGHLTEEEEVTKLIIDNYFLYENCGFSQLYELNNTLTALETETKDTTKALFDESKKAVIENGTTIINLVKPLSGVAMDKIHNVGQSAKNVVNQGSRKLIKILEKVEDKTKNKPNNDDDDYEIIED